MKLRFLPAVAVLLSLLATAARGTEIPNANVVNPVNLVTSVGGSASSDTAALNSSYTVRNAFNGNHAVADANRWIGASGTFPQRAVWTFSNATVVDTIRIYNASYRGANQSPSTFTISGSNDGSEWKTLGTETGVTGWSSSKYRTFGFSNSKPYLKYRLEVTAVQDMTSSEGKRLSITEIELYRLVEATFEVQPDITPTVGIDSFSIGWTLVAESGSTADAGLVWSADETFATATTNSLGMGLFPDDYTATLTGLEPDTTYWWQIYATNATDSSETVAASFTTRGSPVLGTATATHTGDSAMFSVALDEAALANTLATSVSVFYGTNGVDWTEFPLGTASVATNCSGTAESLGYGVTYQWFARATATMEGGRVLSADSATNSFTTLWGGDMYVDGAATNAVCPYSTPETAAKAIATALSIANNGATIHVAPGLYKISAPIEVAKGVRILGGGGDPSRVVISNTVKANYQSGQSVKRIFTLNNAGALVANLTMQKGSAWGDWTTGGNFLISSGGGTVSNCVVEAGEQVAGHASGGGGHLDAGLVTHTVFRRNLVCDSTQWGQNKAGVLYLKGAARAENCLLVDNPQPNAALLVVQEGTSILRNCTIVDSPLSKTNQWCTTFSPLLIGSTASAVNVVIAGVTDKDGVLRKPTGTRANFLNGALDSSIAETSFPTNTVVGTAAEFFPHYADSVPYEVKYRPKTSGPLYNKGATYAPMALYDLSGRQCRVVDHYVDIGCYEANAAGTVILIK